MVICMFPPVARIAIRVMHYALRNKPGAPMPATPASTDPDPRLPGIQSVATAMAVLEALAAGGGPMALSALAQAAGLAPAKAHRYLAALAAAGMVAQRASGAYDLGPRAAALGMAAVARHDPVARASDALPGLVEQSGATAMLSVWGPHGATVVRWEKASPQLVTALGVGATLPLFTSATGRAFLGWLPARLLAEARAREAPRMDDRTFAAEVARARAALPLEAAGNFIPGLFALAVPVRDLAGQAAAVVTLLSSDKALLAQRGPARGALMRLHEGRAG